MSARSSIRPRAVLSRRAPGTDMIDSRARTRRWLVRLHLVAVIVAGASACGSVKWTAARDFAGQPLYLSCNVRAERGEIHDGLYYDTELLPLGSAVTIDQQPLVLPDIASRRQVTDPRGAVPVLILNDRQYRFRHIYGTDQETATDFIGRLVTTDSPEARLATFPPDVQRAIRDAKVRRGMTREQVVLALCRPPAHATPSLEASSWTYWRSSFDRYYVVFGPDGTVSQVHGTNPPEATD